MFWLHNPVSHIQLYWEQAGLGGSQQTLHKNGKVSSKKCWILSLLHVHLILRILCSVFRSRLFGTCNSYGIICAAGNANICWRLSSKSEPDEHWWNLEFFRHEHLKTPQFTVGLNLVQRGPDVFAHTLTHTLVSVRSEVRSRESGWVTAAYTRSSLREGGRWMWKSVGEQRNSPALSRSESCGWQIPWGCGELIRVPSVRSRGHPPRPPGSTGRLCAESRSSRAPRGGWSSAAGWWVFLCSSGQRDHRTGAQSRTAAYRVCDQTSNPGLFCWRVHMRAGPWLSVLSDHFEVRCSPCGGWSPHGDQASQGPTGQSQSPSRGLSWGTRPFEAGPPKRSVSHCADGCIWYVWACLQRKRSGIHTHPDHSQSLGLCLWQKLSDTWLKSSLWCKSGQVLLSYNRGAEPTAGTNQRENS